MGTSRVVTVLFTDLVGSTRLATQLGDEGADRLRQRLFQTLRESIDEHRGQEVKNLGDGLMVALDSAADALDAAVDMQRAVARLNRAGGNPELGLRVGISVGEAASEDGDWFGTPVTEAARLCGEADGGQVLTTEMLRAVVGSRTEHPFVSLGARQLKGLGAPVLVCEVGWGLGDAADGELPAALLPPPEGVFVARGVELDTLMTAWKAAAAGTVRAVLVTGEPGIGKTRLAGELARRVHEAGALVLYGRCDEDLGAAYQPFAEALSTLVERAPIAELGEYLEARSAHLGRLLPQLGGIHGGTGPATAADPEVERYRLFGAVVELLSLAARSAPVLVVLDDLHWAPKPTLVLLRHLLAAAGPVPLLVVGTYRDTDLARTHPLADTLAELRRLDRVERLALAGLDPDGVAAFVEVAAGHTLDDKGRALARAVHAETEGNPFFVGQVLRHLAESGAVYQHEGHWTYDGSLERLGIPEGVKEVIGRRLSRLSEETNRLLQTAAVVGRQFDLDVLCAVAGADEGAALDAVDAAVASRVVEEAPGVLDRFAFSHALVRETLYDELTSSRRARLHRRVAEVLEDLRSSMIEAHLDELAHHYAEAAELDDAAAAKALAYARRAGDAAMAAAAYEQAAHNYERALEMLTGPGGGAGPACELRTSLGWALRGSGQSHRAIEAFSAAAASARQARRPELFARAVLGYADTHWFLNWNTEAGADEVAPLLEEALQQLGPGRSALHAVLLSRLPRNLNFVSTPDQRLTWARQAHEIARELGDGEALLASLYGLCFAYTTPGHLPEHLEAARELAARAEDSDLPAAARDGHYQCLWALGELGDLAGMDEHVDALDRLAERLRDPYGRWMPTAYRAMRAILDGRLDQAEALAFEAYGIAQEMESDWGLAQLGAQLFNIRRYQGRLGELEAPVRTQVETYPLLPAWRCALTYLLAAEDRAQDCRTEFEVLAANDFADIPIDFNWFIAMFELTEACGYLGDARRARTLHRLLAPHADQGIVVSPGTANLGSVRRSLGVLATTMGRFDEAEKHFEAAIAFNRGLGAPLVALTELSLARLLLARNGPGDSRRSSDLLRRVGSTAQELNLGGVATDAESLASSQ